MTDGGPDVWLVPAGVGAHVGKVRVHRRVPAGGGVVRGGGAGVVVVEAALLAREVRGGQRPGQLLRRARGRAAHVAVASRTHRVDVRVVVGLVRRRRDRVAHVRGA